MFVRHSARTLITAALLACALPAAANAGAAQTATVRAGDLNLGSATGRAVLQSRIDQAVRTLCGDVRTRTSLELHQDAVSCSQTARAGAMSQFDALVAAARDGRKVADMSIVSPAVR